MFTGQEWADVPDGPLSEAATTTARIPAAAVIWGMAGLMPPEESAKFSMRKNHGHGQSARRICHISLFWYKSFRWINHDKFDKSIWLIDVDRLTESAIAGWSRQYCSRSEYSGIMTDGCTLHYFTMADVHQYPRIG